MGSVVHDIDTVYEMKFRGKGSLPSRGGGGAGAYGKQHKMHHRGWTGSSWEKKHEVGKLITPSILVRRNSFLCKEVALGLLCPVVQK